MSDTAKMTTARGCSVCGRLGVHVCRKEKWDAMIDALVADLRSGESVVHVSATESEATRVYEAVAVRVRADELARLRASHQEAVE